MLQKQPATVTVPTELLVRVQVSMLAGLCAAVHAFHARDLVLCNLQPEHFAWVPSKQPGWRLLNCSWWVRKGVAARPSYTLQFAAPEVSLLNHIEFVQETCMRLHSPLPRWLLCAIWSQPMDCLACSG